MWKYIKNYQSTSRIIKIHQKLSKYIILPDVLWDRHLCTSYWMMFTRPPPWEYTGGSIGSTLHSTYGHGRVPLGSLGSHAVVKLHGMILPAMGFWIHGSYDVPNGDSYGYNFNWESWSWLPQIPVVEIGGSLNSGGSQNTEMSREITLLWNPCWVFWGFRSFPALGWFFHRIPNTRYILQSPIIIPNYIII